MRNIILSFFRAHNLPEHFAQELIAEMLASTLPATTIMSGASEARVQQAVRFEAARMGEVLWRNNVGACQDETGRHIRYGLCNESKKLNDHVKSSDLIGIKSVLITPEHIGQIIGQFIARECKPSNWKFNGTPREIAQQAFMDIVNSKGGDARFTTGVL